MSAVVDSAVAGGAVALVVVSELEARVVLGAAMVVVVPVAV